MGNRAQVRLTLNAESVSVCTRWGGPRLGQILQEALQYVFASDEYQADPSDDMDRHEAAFILHRLLDCYQLKAGELPDTWLMPGKGRYGADHRGLEVDLDASKVFLYDSDFGAILTEWTLREFADLRIDRPCDALWFDGFDPPEEENTFGWG